MDCPNCRLIVIDGAESCDCGYNFQTGVIRPVRTVSSEQQTAVAKPTGGQVGRRWWWVGLLVVGKVIMRACNDSDRRR